FLTCGWRAARHDRWFQSGAWLGVSAALKPFLLFFLPVLLLRQRWRCVLMAIVSFAASIAAGAIVFGRAAVHEWLMVLRTPPPAEQMTYFINASLSAIFARASLPAAVSIALVGSFMFVSIVVTRAADEDKAWLVTTMSAVLISPLGWVYYLPLFTAPLLAVSTTRGLPVRTWAVWPLLVVPPLGKEWLQSNPLLAVTVGSAYAWGLFLLWCGAAFAPSSDR
ncbi:MAG TPA: glycosyltransferase 87 family protein, partial [Vicinamibacterales bacterium]|nr:glycosyltransferase 87 family protein [Vicinamibacterales bacterium]